MPVTLGIILSLLGTAATTPCEGLSEGEPATPRAEPDAPVSVPLNDAPPMLRLDPVGVAASFVGASPSDSLASSLNDAPGVLWTPERADALAVGHGATPFEQTILNENNVCWEIRFCSDSPPPT